MIVLPSGRAVKPPTSFPFTLPGLAAAYEADVSAYQDTALTSIVTANGQNVKGLKDLSGNGNHLTEGTANPTAQDLGGTRTVRFAGSKYLTRSLGATTTRADVSIHFLIRGDDPGTLSPFWNALLSLDSSANAYFAVPWTTGMTRLHAPFYNPEGSPVPEDFKTHLVSVVYSSSGPSAKFYFDGVLVDTSTDGTPTLDVEGFYLGIVQNGPYYFRGNLAAAYFAYSGHTQQNVTDLYTYCRTRFSGFYPTITNGVVWDCNSLGTPSFVGENDVDLPYVTCTGLTNCGGWWNLAVGGKRTTQMTTDYPTRVAPFFSRMSGKKILVIWELTNDLVLNSASAATAWSNLQAYLALADATGWLTVVGTCLPRGNGSPADFYTRRNALNTLIRDNPSAYDAIADVALNTTIGEDGDETNTTNYIADDTHLNATGTAIAAGIFETAIQGLIDA